MRKMKAYEIADAYSNIFFGSDAHGALEAASRHFKAPEEVLTNWGRKPNLDHFCRLGFVPGAALIETNAIEIDCDCCGKMIRNTTSIVDIREKTYCNQKCLFSAFEQSKTIIPHDVNFAA